MMREPLTTARVVVSAVTSLAFIACANAQADRETPRLEPPSSISAEASWSLRLPKDDKVVYRGVTSFDTAGTSSQSLLYPAPNVAGFLAAVITHAVIADTAQTRQRSQLQQSADRVLSPYQSVLSNYSHRELMQKALDNTASGGKKKLVELTETPGADWIIDSAPVFSMTQDQRALILENALAIYRPGAPSVAAYRNTIKVVSMPYDRTDLLSFWSENDGEKLKDESARLVARSLDIGMSDAIGRLSGYSNSHKTFRYFEGGTEKMERAQLIREDCERVLIKTLRGWLMSIPAAHVPQPASDRCSNASETGK